MNGKIIAVIVVVAVAVAAGVWFLMPAKPHAALTLSFRVVVSPKERFDAVVNKANSIKFKYEVSKQANVKPVFAQQLAIKRVPNSAMFDLEVGVMTKAEAEQYLKAFVETLQAMCGPEVQLGLVSHSVR